MQVAVADMKQDDWSAFNVLVQSIDEIIEARGLRHAVVFHGTSDHHLRSLSTAGMKPTDIALAKWRDEHEEFVDNAQGTFWGRITTAAWYATDNVIERYGFGRPLLVVTTTTSLLQRHPLHPDMATFDSPVDKLMPIMADSSVMQDWMVNGGSKTWSQALDELGAVFAIHDDVYPSSALAPIESVDEFEEFLINSGLSPSAPTI